MYWFCYNNIQCCYPTSISNTTILTHSLLFTHTYTHTVLYYDGGDQRVAPLTRAGIIITVVGLISYAVVCDYANAPAESALSWLSMLSFTAEVKLAISVCK